MGDVLSREQFREQVFARDLHKCVCCKVPAVDAHHILDRSLWDDGGYYLENGASLCADCHLKAEMTLISCDELRKLAGIYKVLLPEHMYDDEKYDHWGNILKKGYRIKGELFGQENVQRVLREAGLLESFTKYVKYPRTYHFSWSPNLQNDDRQHKDVDFFEGKEITCTIKMDGENTSMYRDYIHARSLDSVHHDSRSYVKSLHGALQEGIPDGWRVCAENLYAEHSISYEHLPSYLLVFSVWDDNNVCLSWEDVETYSGVLGLKTVPVFYRGLWDKDTVHEAFEKYSRTCPDPVEGYVVRLSGAFAYKDYRHAVAKYVRAGHVQTDQFWMSKPVVPNRLSQENNSR